MTVRQINRLTLVFLAFMAIAAVAVSIWLHFDAASGRYGFMACIAVVVLVGGPLALLKARNTTQPLA